MAELSSIARGDGPGMCPHPMADSGTLSQQPNEMVLGYVHIHYWFENSISAAQRDGSGICSHSWLIPDLHPAQLHSPEQSMVEKAFATVL